MDPAPVRINARWPAHRRLVIDTALACGAVAAAIGYGLFARPGLVGVLVGAVLGAAVAAVIGPRRYHLTLDAEGVSIGRLTGTVRMGWAEVAAVGIEDGWIGRRGLTMALAVGRRGDDWPMAVPALAYHSAGFRVGGASPSEQLAPYRTRLLASIRPWAEARAVPVVEGDLDDWWDRNRDLFTR